MIKDFLQHQRYMVRSHGPRGFIKAFRKNYFRPWSRAQIQKHMPYGQGLEIGCGAQTIAPLSRTLLSDGHRSHAHNQSLATEFFPADQIPYADETFSFVLSEHVLEHLPNPIRVLMEWRRVLKNDGVIFLGLPHPERTFDRYREVTSIEHLKLDFQNQTHDLSESERIHFQEWKKNVLDRGLAPHYAGVSEDEALKTSSLHRHVFHPASFSKLAHAAGLHILDTVDQVPDRQDSFWIVLGK